MNLIKIDNKNGEVECKNCGNVFSKNAHNQKFCSPICRVEFNENK